MPIAHANNPHSVLCQHLLRKLHQRIRPRVIRKGIVLCLSISAKSFTTNQNKGGNFVLDPVIKIASISSNCGYLSGCSSTCHFVICKSLEGSNDGESRALAPLAKRYSKTPPYPPKRSLVLGKGLSHSSMAMRRGGLGMSIDCGRSWLAVVSAPDYQVWVKEI